MKIFITILHLITSSRYSLSSLYLLISHTRKNNISVFSFVTLSGCLSFFCLSVMNYLSYHFMSFPSSMFSENAVLPIDEANQSFYKSEEIAYFLQPLLPQLIREITCP